MEQKTTKTITISPQMFINKPYIKCPKCNNKQFGILMINRRSYVRKCVDCHYKESFSLPSISKKLIYMDQFAISEMMKVLNQNDKANKKVDPYWLEVFEKLDHLVKLQLIICPESFTHQDESLVAGDRYKPLRRIYELLSNGVSFYDSDTIKRFQINHALLEWLEKPSNKDLTAHDMTGDDIDEWQEKFLISVDMLGEDVEAVAEQIREDREKVSNGLKEVCEYWKSQKNVTFKEFYEKERNVFGESILREYDGSIQKIVDMQLGIIPMDVSAYISSNSVLMTQIHNALEKYGISSDETNNKTTDFLRSDQLKEIPYLKISSMMFAALARQFSAGGRVKLVSNGMMNDVDVISSLAPYCDAMFIDKECETIFSQNKSRIDADLSVKVFSLNKKEEFLNYLDDVEKSADPKHLKLVSEVYGEKWEEPFVKIFKK